MVSSLQIGTDVPERFDPHLWPSITKEASFMQANNAGVSHSKKIDNNG